MSVCATVLFTLGIASSLAGAVPLQAASGSGGPLRHAISEPTPSEAENGVAEITGKVWKWQTTLMNDDSKRSPSDPARYTLRLEPDGALSVQADCNVLGGTYAARGQNLSLTITHGTMAMCPPESLDQAYLKDLSEVRIFLIQKGELYLDLRYDSGTMRFAE